MVAFRDMIPVLVSPSLSTLLLSACLSCRRSREVLLMRGWTNNRSPARCTLDYVRSTPKNDSRRGFEPLPDEEVDLDSIDYIYRAILAQEKRDRQQASSEG